MSREYATKEGGIFSTICYSNASREGRTVTHLNTWQLIDDMAWHFVALYVIVLLVEKGEQLHVSIHDNWLVTWHPILYRTYNRKLSS